MTSIAIAIAGLFVVIDIPGLCIVGGLMYNLVNKRVTDPIPHGMIT
jgi:hypothetical protein